MREAASRGYFLASRAPFGYKRIKVSDGMKDRPTLEIDPDAAPIIKEIFESSRRGNGLKEICKELNDRGITNRGKRWQKSPVHAMLTNEAYTGTAVWGVNSKDPKTGEPVRVENAWPALVARETFEAVQQGLHQRAPAQQRPARVGSQYLLSGLLRCGVCGKSYSGQAAKSGQFAYYVCARLLREGAGSCTGRYLNAERVEDYIIEKVRERILTEETITELVTLVAEEIDALAGEVNSRLKAIAAELADVESRLENLYQALETKQLPIEALSPRILSLKARQDKLVAAKEEAEGQLERRRADLPTSREIKGYVADFREFLKEGTFPERKALIRNFVEGIEIVDDAATLTYTIPMPQDGVTREAVFDGETFGQRRTMGDHTTAAARPQTSAVPQSGTPGAGRPQGANWHSVRTEERSTAGGLPQETGCGSGMTPYQVRGRLCWRWLPDWQPAGVWQNLHETLLSRLHGADRLD